MREHSFDSKIHNNPSTSTNHDEPIYPCYKSLHVIYELTKEKEKKWSQVLCVVTDSIFMKPEDVVSNEAEDMRI